MPRKTIVTVFGVEFTTQTSLTEEIRRRFLPYTTGENALKDEIEIVGEDRAWFDEYLTTLKPEDSRGYGINRLWRTTNSGVVGNHLRVEWRDGRTTRPSWRRAMKPDKTASKERAVKAFRASVNDQVTLAVAKAFCSPGYRCPKSGVEIYQDTGHYHVHHDGFEFAEILSNFLDAHGLTLEATPLAENKDAGGCRVCPTLESKWKKFHAEQARRVVVEKEWHKSHHHGGKGSVDD